ncbi:MAG: hypothetical protein Ct9H300mP3_00820 [Gammaproteobacteria bacterium]|nr:MAG: hypothetical protein Ct9H300mP3_00820 [Gammaproteobacteria bacterium]
MGEKRGLMQNVLDFGGQPEFSVKLLKDLASTQEIENFLVWEQVLT